MLRLSRVVSPWYLSILMWLPSLYAYGTRQTLAVGPHKRAWPSQDRLLHSFMPLGFPLLDDTSFYIPRSSLALDGPRRLDGDLLPPRAKSCFFPPLINVTVVNLFIHLDVNTVRFFFCETSTISQKLLLNLYRLIYLDTIKGYVLLKIFGKKSKSFSAFVQ